MPRPAREKSPVGMYHIMARGNNKQCIFIDDEDRMQFISYLEALPLQYDADGTILNQRNCALYAYCLMPNHVHLLYREMNEGMDSSMKRLLSKYAFYFNTKYGRVGHLFQDRFRSEPCNDMEYFITLLRYIHQNPVMAGITETVCDYPWSSWHEYENYGKRCSEVSYGICSHVCDVAATLKRYPIQDLTYIVNETLPDDIGCLDDHRETRQRYSESEILGILKRIMNITSPSDIEHLTHDEQIPVIREIYKLGASLNQIVRVTGLSYRQVYSAIKD